MAGWARHRLLRPWSLTSERGWGRRQGLVLTARLRPRATAANRSDGRRVVRARTGRVPYDRAGSVVSGRSLPVRTPRAQPFFHASARSMEGADAGRGIPPGGVGGVASPTDELVPADPDALHRVSRTCRPARSYPSETERPKASRGCDDHGGSHGRYPIPRSPGADLMRHP